MTGRDVAVEVVAAEKPERTGIDPHNKLGDRNFAGLGTDPILPRGPGGQAEISGGARTL